MLTHRHALPRPDPGGSVRDKSLRHPRDRLCAKIATEQPPRSPRSATAGRLRGSGRGQRDAAGLHHVPSCVPPLPCPVVADVQPACSLSSRPCSCPWSLRLAPWSSCYCPCCATLSSSIPLHSPRSLSLRRGIASIGATPTSTHNPPVPQRPAPLLS